MAVTRMLQHIIKVACALYLLIFCILCYFFEHFLNHVLHFVVHPWAIFNSFLLLSISQPKMSNVKGKGKNKMNKKWSSCESYQETSITKLGTSISCGFGPSKVRTSSFIGHHWFKILLWKCCFEMGKKYYNCYGFWVQCTYITFKCHFVQ